MIVLLEDDTVGESHYKCEIGMIADVLLYDENGHMIQTNGIVKDILE